nr:MAG TPA: hypothetical protein [Caudoviricetes sp.]
MGFYIIFYLKINKHNFYFGTDLITKFNEVTG